jgi:two-component system sensor kinase FixL
MASRRVDIGSAVDSKFYQQIVGSVSEALVTIDQDRQVVVWNRAAETMFGYERAEIEAQGIDVIIPPGYRERHRAAYEGFVETVGFRATYVSETKELEALRKGGEIFPIELTHSLYKVTESRFYVTAIIRDISERKRYEIMRQRLEQITRHDLKNKLVIIAMAAKRMASVLQEKPWPESSKYLGIIDQESKDSLELLESSRELILLESGEYQSNKKAVDLVTILAAKREQMEPLGASKDVALIFVNRTDKQVLPLMADRPLLERAVENLIKNAIEAEDPSGRVRLALVENRAGEAVLEVHNGGSPIPEELQKTIFQPYVTHGKESGSGLGLYAARIILERIHGWQLSFESGAERGTVFRIVFQN